MNKIESTGNMFRGAAQVKMIGAIAAVVVCAIVLGTYIAQGQVLEAYLGVMVVIGLVALQQLRSSFWLLIPFAIVSQLPAISIIVASLSLGELWILVSMVFVALFWIPERRKVKLALSGPGKWMYAYALWAFLIYLNNPVGLSSAGASAGGFRFYLKIGLGLIAFLIIANSKMGERNAKIIILLLFFGVLAETLFNIAGVFVPQVSFLTATAGKGADDGGFYSWLQILAVLPATAIPLIFARYTLRDLLAPNRWGMVLLLVILFGMVFYSGKRSIAVLALTYPAMIAMFRGNFLTAVALALGAVFGFAGLWGLHNSGMRLPKTAQRVLAIVPDISGLDREVERSADNDFRETLNKYALREIRARPILGEGFKVDQDVVYGLQNDPGRMMEAGDHVGAMEFTSTSSWHNTWLGISADFGIPAAMIYGLLIFSYIYWSLKVLRRLDQSSFQWTLVAALLATVVGEMIRSWQFGHASLSYWAISWKVGVLFAVWNWINHQFVEGEAAEPPNDNEARVVG